MGFFLRLNDAHPAINKSTSRHSKRFFYCTTIFLCSKQARKTEVVQFRFVVLFGVQGSLIDEMTGLPLDFKTKNLQTSLPIELAQKKRQFKEAFITDDLANKSCLMKPVFFSSVLELEMLHLLFPQIEYPFENAIWIVTSIVNITARNQMWPIWQVYLIACLCFIFKCRWKSDALSLVNWLIVITGTPITVQWIFSVVNR